MLLPLQARLVFGLVNGIPEKVWNDKEPPVTSQQFFPTCSCAELQILLPSAKIIRFPFVR